MPERNAHLKFFGIVQGVGFRPFIYRVATDNGLNGWVRNTGDGVEVVFSGDSESVELAIRTIRNDNPPMSEITRVEYLNDVEYQGNDFHIKPSSSNSSSAILVPPDICICKNCRNELLKPDNPRFRHPFISCTDCGPRMSILTNLPYDRHNITQNEFELCNFCESEYNDSWNRRYHAQTIACNKCGPSVRLGEASGYKAIVNTKEAIKSGEVIGIKGIGGFHLACLASDASAVSRIRDLKQRGDEAMAVMVDSLATANRLASISTKERELLDSWRAPIVILEKSDSYDLANNVAPGTNKIGVFLPYTPVHVLLMVDMPPIVLTSANLHDEPLASNDGEFIFNIPILTNDRDISNPIDDSVMDIVFDKPRVLRRARGFVPDTIKINTETPVLALGTQMKSTFCFAWNNQALVSPHIGEMHNANAFKRYMKILESYRSLFGFNESITAYDMHPGYMSAIHKNEISNAGVFIPIQHHHAHIASVMVEHDIDEQVIGIAADGTGYGTDGTIWGFEFLIANRSKFIRAGHLRPFALPGGDSAVKDAGRTLYSMLSQINQQDKARIEDELSNVLSSMLKSKMNAPMTSSLGRLFDGFSVLTGLGRIASFEAQLAILLESNYDRSHPPLPFTIEDKGDHFEVDWRMALLHAISRPGSIPGGFHKGIALSMVNGCRMLRDKTGIEKVALSGGCFANRILLSMVVNALEKMGLEVYFNQKFPPGDGCVSLGQATVAIAKLRESKN